MCIIMCWGSGRHHRERVLEAEAACQPVLPGARETMELSLLPYH